MARKTAGKKTGTRTTAAAASKGKRVIVTEAFEGLHWGAEIEIPAGARYERLKKEGKIRDDDRMLGSRPAPASPTPAEPADTSPTASAEPKTE